MWSKSTRTMMSTISGVNSLSLSIVDDVADFIGNWARLTEFESSARSETVLMMMNGTTIDAELEIAKRGKRGSERAKKSRN